MAINIISEIIPSDTIVPNVFIDEYMPKANGEFVKIYLYLLRTVGSGTPCDSISAVADCFDQTEKDVVRALNYWVKEGIIALSFDEKNSICGITLLPFTNTDGVSTSGNAVSTATDDSSSEAAINSVSASDSKKHFSAAIANQGDAIAKSITSPTEINTAEINTTKINTAEINTTKINAEDVMKESSSLTGINTTNATSQESAETVQDISNTGMPINYSNSASNTGFSISYSNSASNVLAAASYAGKLGSADAQQTAPPKEYTADDISAFLGSAEVKELFFILEVYLKHPLAATEINTVLYWLDGLKFSTELITYLAEYCITKGHSSLHYMNKVALNWAKENITTVEQAKSNNEIHSKPYYTVLKALGISGRNLVDSEIDYVNKWSKDYAFDLDIIKEACNRTISAIHRPSFEYTDSILTKWHNNGVHTLKDIEAVDAVFEKNKKFSVNNVVSGSTSTPKTVVRKNKFTNFNQRSHSNENLEKLLLNSSVQ